MFIVLAASAEEAKAWGDRLARDRAQRVGEPFRRCTIEPHICIDTIPALAWHRCPNYPDAYPAPVVRSGVTVADDAIGW